MKFELNWDVWAVAIAVIWDAETRGLLVLLGPLYLGIGRFPA